MDQLDVMGVWCEDGKVVKFRNGNVYNDFDYPVNPIILISETAIKMSLLDYYSKGNK